MTSLIISNCTEEIVGDLALLTADQCRSFGWGAQRMLWYARNGDIVVLPGQPDGDFLTYVTGLTGTDPSSLTLLIPPPGEFGADILSPDRLANEEFREQLRLAATERAVGSVLSVYTDFAVADLARATGIGDGLAGMRFSAEQGDAIVNSKAIFRAVAAAAGTPIARGLVTGRREQAMALICELLEQGDHVMVKKEFAAGGFGNEILSPAPGVRAAGAPQVVVLTDRVAVADYLAERWSWLTGDGHSRLVIEQYLPQIATVYAEFEATDSGCTLRGTGEIVMAPTAVGEIIPPQSIEAETHRTLVELAHLVCERFRLFGYRGNICADAIVTPDGEIVFTETNGRLTASTHLHVNMVGRVVDAARRRDRVFMERAGQLTVPSFAHALEQLAASGLGYDDDAATGVVLTANYVPVNGRVTYCVVAESLVAAQATEEKLLEVMAGVFAR